MGENRSGNETRSQQAGVGLVLRKGYNNYWNNCTEAYVSAQSDEYIIGEERRGSTGEYSSNTYPQWYTDLKGNTANIGDYWLGVAQERTMESVGSTGGEINKRQCGANSGGGDEAAAGVAILCAKQISAPSNLTSSYSNGEVTLDWDYSDSPIKGFRVYRSSSSGSSTSDYTQIGTVQNQTTLSNGFDDMSAWSTSNGGQATDRVYGGSYSYYSGNNNTNEQARWTPYPNGKQVESFQFFYQETSNSTGSGVRLVNSNGNYEGGIATDNPQYDVDFANTSGEVNAGGDYDEWVKVRMEFNWSNSEVTVSIEGLTSGNTHTSTYTLKQGVDISRVELWNYNGGVWGDGNLDAWWDNLRFTTSVNGPITYSDTSPSSGENYYRVVAYHDGGESPISGETFEQTITPVGSLEFEAQNGTDNLPIYTSGSSGGEVYESLRVKTGSEVGFVPLTHPPNAFYPHIRVQTENNGVLAVHDSVTSYSWEESFEEGNASDWSGSNYYIKTDNAVDGAYSLGTDNQGAIDAEITPDGWSGGAFPEFLVYYWWEETNQSGHAVRFVDPSGNLVLRSGTENPQWYVGDGDSSKTEIYAGDGYQRWIRYYFEFDWSAGTYTYTFEDTSSGTTRTGTRNLASSNGIKTVKVINDYGSANYNRFDFFSTINPVAGDLANIQTKTFNYTGSEQTWTVPDGVSNVTIECWGAEGSQDALEGIPGGKGGYEKATLSVSSSDTLNINVGESGNQPSGGWPNGGDGATDSGSGAGGGGGSSDVRLNGTAVSDIVVIAGGGGGAGRGVDDGAGGDGGSVATDGEGAHSNAQGGHGGAASGFNGENGSRDENFGYVGTGGGGGGGLNGGAGGGAYADGGQFYSAGAGGGGGDGDVLSPATTVSEHAGDNTGNGKVVITWIE